MGVYVTAHVSDNSVVVTFDQFQDGMAPALLVNSTDSLDIIYRQK